MEIESALRLPKFCADVSHYYSNSLVVHQITESRIESWNRTLITQILRLDEGNWNMCRMEETHPDDRKRSKPLDAGIIAAVLAILTPAALNLSFDLVTDSIIYANLMFMFWTINLGPGIVNPPGTFSEATVIPDAAVAIPYGLIGNLPITFLRVVFVYQIYRYYQGRTTRGRTLLAAAAGELQVTIMGLFFMSMPTFSLTVQFLVPTPIMFVAGLVMIKMAPTNQLSTPWPDQEDSDSWWTEQSEDEGGAVQVKEGPWQKKKQTA